MNEQHEDSNSSAEHEVKRMGRGMLYVFWVIVLVFLSWGASKWLGLQNNPNSNPVRRTDAQGVNEVVLQRNRYGHYVTSGEINGQPVLLMLDTGASDVAVPEKMAKRLRLEKLAPIKVSTANGFAEAWLTRIAEVKIGGIVLRDVRASINPGLNHDDSILLGMSALKAIEFTQKGDQLILRH